MVTILYAQRIRAVVTQKWGPFSFESNVGREEAASARLKKSLRSLGNTSTATAQVSWDIEILTGEKDGRKGCMGIGEDRLSLFPFSPRRSIQRSPESDPLRPVFHLLLSPFLPFPLLPFS